MVEQLFNVPFTEANERVEHYRKKNESSKEPLYSIVKHNLSNGNCDLRITRFVVLG